MAPKKNRINTKIEMGAELTPPTVNKDSRSKREPSLWWKLPRPKDGTAAGESERPHRALFELVDRLKTEQKPRLDRIERHMRLYGGRNFTRLTAKGFQQSDARDEATVAFNGIQSVVDTIMSKIAKNKPVPTFLTEGGNFEERMRAKKLSRYVSGVFHDQQVYKKSRLVTKSACILGTGAFYPYRDGNRVAVEWVFPAEIIVDDEEAFYGRPGNIYREKNVPRDTLIDTFPDHADKIRAVEAAEETGQTDISVDQVRVIEGWHLASKPGEDEPDGRHVIAINNETLQDGPYAKTYDPFVWLHWSDPLIGWWGRGLSEELQGLQVETNRLLSKIQKIFHLAAVPWVLMPASANVSTADIRNTLGLILRYQGTVPPKVQTHQTVHPEVFAHLERLVRMMYEKAGISQLSASSKKPAGIESGIALREYHDIETERLVLFGQSHENAHLELARRIVDISRVIAKETEQKEGHGKLSVRAPGRRDFTTIAWDEVNMDDERYVMQVFPVSSLPSSPAGRMEEVLDMLKAGFLDLPVAMQLLDFPDISAEKNIQLAALENIDWVISEILEEGKYHPPQPFQDLSLGMARMNSVYLMAMTDRAPEGRLEMLRRWMLAAENMVAPAAPPATPGPALPAPAPGAGPPLPPPNSAPAQLPPPAGPPQLA